jgi:dTDP-4-dehydrorhamnose reductase
MIVVTGASGLLGANFVSCARDHGREVVGICHRHMIEMPQVPMFAVDLTEPSAMRQLLMRLRPESIVHCAATTNVDWCEDHPQEAERLNGKASGDLAEIAAELDARFLYVSTDAVFDGKAGNYSERDQPFPVNAYARSKLNGERQVSDRHPQPAVARVNLYGWNAQNKFSLAEWVLDRLTEGLPVPGFTDVYFTPILASDLAEILLTMLERGLTGVYHVGGSERISKYDFARLLAESFGFEPGRISPARLAEAGLRASRPPDVSLNTTKTRAALARELPDVMSGVRRFRQQRENGHARRLKNYLAGEGK